MKSAFNCYRLQSRFQKLMRSSSLLTLAAVASLTVSASAKWSRLPSVGSKPVSITTIMNGTKLESSSGLGQPNTLLLGDPIKAVTVASGKSDAVIKFIKQSLVNEASFVSDGIEGKVSLSLSSDGKAWSPLDSIVCSSSDRFIKLAGGSAQGRFLRIDFELSRGGSIRSFQALGSDTDANYTVSQSPDGSGIGVNFAAGVGGGRLLYINPEAFSGRGDAARTNRIEFPESDDKYRTAVYDLGQVRTLNEFGSVHSPRPVRLAVYAFDTLPEKEDWRGRLTFDPAVFDSSEPVARAEDASGAGFLKAKPNKAVKTRYIALRWEPDFNPPGFSVDGISVSGSGDVSYKDGDTKVDTTTDANGNTQTTVGGEGGAGEGGQGAGGEGAETGSAPTINGTVIGAPSSGGVGPATGPSNNP